MTMPVNMNPVENSGSLTGHILAQGWRDGDDTGAAATSRWSSRCWWCCVSLVGRERAVPVHRGRRLHRHVSGVFNSDEFVDGGGSP